MLPEPFLYFADVCSYVLVPTWRLLVFATALKSKHMESRTVPASKDSLNRPKDQLSCNLCRKKK